MKRREIITWLVIFVVLTLAGFYYLAEFVTLLEHAIKK